MYEQSISQYVVFRLADDSISVTKGEKEYEIRRQKKTATIDSSLWEAIVGAGMPASLAAEMEDIYQSTISFFSIQKGDNFTVIYDERYIDTLPAGIGAKQDCAVIRKTPRRLQSGSAAWHPCPVSPPECARSAARFR